jgi:hypothetical protein
MYLVARNHGIKGVFNYLRDGNSHPRHVRERLKILQAISVRDAEKEKSLHIIEEGLKYTNRRSLNAERAKDLRQAWEQNDWGSNLRTSLSLLIYDLDHLSAQIDRVVSTREIEATSELSNRVTGMIKRAASLLLQPYLQRPMRR